MALFNRFLKDESGATAIEYALIAGLIGVALVTALGLLGGQIEGIFGRIGGALDEVSIGGGNEG